ncbi:cell wall protein Ecm33 [Extremus antarcticus]|uniref:Cell wall protein Ecm33 n=1 Tax=Extremus antarcticus TaxID=702011 RepID=A0AAJ0DRT6_9PEZI|nr:cell wall protein Ecm33 [Extremus antarcticus]
MTLRYLVPALAVVGSAAAACNGPYTISSSADAAAISTCQTYSGDIAVATGNADDIALNGIRRITGSLTVKANNKMSSLSADSLSQIDDSFQLRDLQLLSTLNFPSLQSVNTVDWEGLPNLGALSFTAGLSKVASLSIQNTVLGSLDGVNLVEVDTLFVVNNFYLNHITMQLGNVSTALTLSANGNDVQASFPNLEWATNMTLANCSSIDLQSLSAVNGSLGFYSNYMQSLSFPNLTMVGQSFYFVDNPSLTNISAPSVKTVGGGLVMSNNTDLQTVNGFNKLESVGGAVDFNGNFKNVMLPALQNVRGGFNLQSKQNVDSSCARFKPLSGGRASPIKGKFVCKTTAQPQSKGNGNGGSSTSGGSSSSSSSPANPILISGATGVLGVVAAIFGML